MLGANGNLIILTESAYLNYRFKELSQHVKLKFFTPHPSWNVLFILLEIVKLNFASSVPSPLNHINARSTCTSLRCLLFSQQKNERVSEYITKKCMNVRMWTLITTNEEVTRATVPLTVEEIKSPRGGQVAGPRGRPYARIIYFYFVININEIIPHNVNVRDVGKRILFIVKFSILFFSKDSYRLSVRRCVTAPN